MGAIGRGNGETALHRGTRQVAELLEMIKFSHSLFALPFALTAMLVAAEGLPSARVIALILVCMVTARTAAMTFNRIVDRRLDAANPRTAMRALPAGRVSLAAAWALFALAAAGFVLAASLINRGTMILAPIALVIILSYSLAKRFTSLTHFLLGLSLAIAPVGAWIAVRGRIDPPVLALAFGVLAWTAGFDLLYACQDADFDRKAGLSSLPARLGIARSLDVARACHAAALGALLLFGIATQRGPAYFVALVVAAGLLAWSHAIVRPDDLSRVQLAFFQANVGVAAVILAGTALDVFL